VTNHGAHQSPFILRRSQFAPMTNHHDPSKAAAAYVKRRSTS
jgi:hypothetical protein